VTRAASNAPPRSAEATQARILAAAEACFIRFGIQRATVADIAKAAGIRRQGVYDYFRGRDDLLLAVTAEKITGIYDRCRAVVDAQTCIADGLVEGLLYAVGEGLADPYLRMLLTPNEVDFTTTLVAASDLLRTITAQMWLPVLERGQRQGELQADLDLDQTNRWFMNITMMLMATHATGISDAEADRTLLKRMLLPALIT
jgi:AcrR family transcriptional regulator